MNEHSVTSTLKRAEHTLRAPATATGKYLYAVIHLKHDLDYPSAGIAGADIYSISEGQLSAVVSDVFNPRVRAERQHLAAHRDVLARLMAGTTPLPISFGTIAGSAQAIRKTLSRNQQALLEQLRRVAGKVEMGLRVFWDVPNIFEYFITTHPELRAARDCIFGGQREPRQEEKLEIGRMFDRLLQEDREASTQTVEEAFAPYCVEIKRNQCRNEREVMNLACLLRREDQAGFETHVFAAASLFDTHYAFDYNGPWPPYNFVDLALAL